MAQIEEPWEGSCSAYRVGLDGGFGRGFGGGVGGSFGELGRSGLPLPFSILSPLAILTSQDFISLFRTFAIKFLIFRNISLSSATCHG